MALYEDDIAQGQQADDQQPVNDQQVQALPDNSPPTQQAAPQPVAQDNDDASTTEAPVSALDALGGPTQAGKDAEFIRSMNRVGGISPEEMTQQSALARTLEAQDTYQKMQQLDKMYQNGAITAKQLADAGDQLYNQRVPDGKMGISFTNSSDPNGSLTHVVYDPKTGKTQSQVMTPDQVYAMHQTAMAALGAAIDPGKARQEGITNAQNQQKINNEGELQAAQAEWNKARAEYELTAKGSIAQQTADAKLLAATNRLEALRRAGSDGKTDLGWAKLSDAERKQMLEENKGLFEYDNGLGAGQNTKNEYARTAFATLASAFDPNTAHDMISKTYQAAYADPASQQTDKSGNVVLGPNKQPVVDMNKFHQVYTQRLMAMDAAMRDNVEKRAQAASAPVPYANNNIGGLDESKLTPIDRAKLRASDPVAYDRGVAIFNKGRAPAPSSPPAPVNAPTAPVVAQAPPAALPALPVGGEGYNGFRTQLAQAQQDLANNKGNTRQAISARLDAQNRINELTKRIQATGS
jgi:hypothetical protein